MGLRDEILAASDLRHEDVLVPEWGHVMVRVTELNALDRVEWDEESAALREASGGKQENAVGAAVRFVRRSLRDPLTGDPLFLREDEPSLARKNSRVIQRLFSIAVRLNALGEKEIESAAGKSAAAPSDAPRTD